MARAGETVRMLSQLLLPAGGKGDPLRTQLQLDGMKTTLAILT